ncbi:response regulator [Dyella subtropica]|uniref:response regulator n=1 Tax=Dyella subtropica TaxID=2992127 RepID=UPI00224EE604|nr:response regulator [Dyella subtropica]
MNEGAPDILLVEDSPTTAELFAIALKFNKSNATIQVVRDGEAALDLLLGDAPPPGSGLTPLPRLLVLDVHMPRLNGFQVLERLRADERTRLLPAVMYSGSDLDSDKHEALRRGANGFVRKPVGFKEACEVIAQLERDWLTSDAASQSPSP